MKEGVYSSFDKAGVKIASNASWKAASVDIETPESVDNTVGSFSTKTVDPGVSCSEIH
jgi:hypothetical protein